MPDAFSMTNLVSGAKLEVPDVPEGCVIRGIDPRRCPELCRLSVYHTDARQAQIYLQIAERLDSEEEDQREALFIAALLRLLICFEGSREAANQPLKPSKVFTAAQRIRFRDFQGIRNTLVAHDDRLYGGVSMVAAVDFLGTTKRVYSLTAGFKRHTVGGWTEGLRDLVDTCVTWTSRRIEEESRKVGEALNALPGAQRMALRNAPDFTINIHHEDALWRKGK